MKPARGGVLQPPVGPRVVLRFAEQNDPRRLRQVAEILANILDRAGTPDEGRRS